MRAVHRMERREGREVRSESESAKIKGRVREEAEGRGERGRTKMVPRCTGTWLKANLFTLFTYKLLVCLFTYFPPSQRARARRSGMRCGAVAVPVSDFKCTLSKARPVARDFHRENFHDGVAFNLHRGSTSPGTSASRCQRPRK